MGRYGAIGYGYKCNQFRPCRLGGLVVHKSPVAIGVCAHRHRHTQLKTAHPLLHPVMNRFHWYAEPAGRLANPHPGSSDEPHDHCLAFHPPCLERARGCLDLLAGTSSTARSADRSGGYFIIWQGWVNQNEDGHVTSQLPQFIPLLRKHGVGFAPTIVVEAPQHSSTIWSDNGGVHPFGYGLLGFSNRTDQPGTSPAKISTAAYLRVGVAQPETKLLQISFQSLSASFR